MLLNKPLWINRLQLVLLILFVLTSLWAVHYPSKPKDLPPSMHTPQLRLLALGEPQLLARYLEYWLLRFDTQAGAVMRLESLNYAYLIGWLTSIQTLDPRSDYPGLVATGYFSAVNDPQRLHLLLEFVNTLFLQAPAQRWRWQAQAVLLAKYRLNDLELALSLAQALREQTGLDLLPAWARELELIILQDLGEFAAAEQAAISLLESGVVTQPDEVKYLRRTLQELQRQ